MEKMKRGMGDAPTHAPSQLQRLERQPHARRRIVAVVLIPFHGSAVQNLRQLQRGTCRQVVTGEVERRVRGKPPGEPTVDFSPDVAGITRDKALVAHHYTGRAARGARRTVKGRAPGAG